MEYVFTGQSRYGNLFNARTRVERHVTYRERQRLGVVSVK